MDIIIPYKIDPFGGIELRYALRAIEKNLTGYRDVYIVGDVPAWAKGLAHVSCSHDPDRKEWDICKKILRACEITEVSNSFIMWHDDHFLLSPLCVLDMKNWYGGLLSDVLKKSRSGYKQAVENTIDKFKHGRGAYPILNFDIHVPCVFTKSIFRAINTPAWGKEYCLKSVYYNTGFYDCCSQMDDLKINETGLSKETIYKTIRDRLFFSSGPLALEPNLIEVFEEIFPKKSMYEK